MTTTGNRFEIEWLPGGMGRFYFRGMVSLKCAAEIAALIDNLGDEDDMNRTSLSQLAAINLSIDAPQFGHASERLPPDDRERYRACLDEAKRQIAAARDILSAHADAGNGK